MSDPATTKRPLRERISSGLQPWQRWSKMSVIAYTLVALIWLGVLAGVALRYTTFTSNPLLAFAAFSAYLMAPAPLALLILLLRRQWIGVLVALALTVLAAAMLVPRYVAAGSDSAAGRHLTVMTSNLRLGEGDAASVVRLVREHKVEVLMLQELTPQERTRLQQAGLDDLLPHSIIDARGGAAGVGLWSVYPLADTAMHPEFFFGLVSARLVIDGATDGPVVASSHMPGPWPGKPLNWQLNITRLPTLLTTLAEQARTSGSDVLVAGDFNATLDTKQFRDLLTNGYHDAAEQSGAGLVRTYPSDVTFPPLIGIDHVLTHGAVGRSVQTATVSKSDHRAVITSIQLTTK